MQWYGIRVPVVILALVLGLAAFWGGQWLYGRYNYERPLTKLLGENKDVVSYKINEEGPVLEVEVKLGKVDDLQRSYNALHQSVQDVVGRRDFKIILQDERDATLERVHYQARLAVYEAMERGNFLEMEGYISRQAGREGSQARLMLDEDRVYIQITHGDHYLYEIIPRTKVAGTVFSGEGGSLS